MGKAGLQTGFMRLIACVKQAIWRMRGRADFFKISFTAYFLDENDKYYLTQIKWGQREDATMADITSTKYANRVQLNLPYQQAIERLTQALKDEGFGVLTEIDMQATLKTKLNTDLRPYIILGICHPPFAQRTLDTDLDAGLLLPCNAVVYEDDGGSVVAILDPLTMIGVTKNPELESIAEEAKQKLDRVLASLN